MGWDEMYEMKTADAFGSAPSAHRQQTCGAENSHTMQERYGTDVHLRATRDEGRGKTATLLSQFQGRVHRLVRHRES